MLSSGVTNVVAVTQEPVGSLEVNQLGTVATSSDTSPGSTRGYSPRARRVRSDLPVRYRGKNLSTWYEGNIQNISQSGVLFEGPQQLPANALVELIFEMPEEISGQKDRNVLCQGRLIRINAPENESVDKSGDEENQETFGLVASILDYKFLHKE